MLQVILTLGSEHCRMEVAKLLLGKLYQNKKKKQNNPVLTQYQQTEITTHQRFFGVADADLKIAGLAYPAGFFYPK